MPMEVTGKLAPREPGEQPSFEGCRIEVLFGRRPSRRRETISAFSDAEGRFTFVSPDGPELPPETVRFVVLSPEGRVIGDAEVATADLEDAVSIEVAAPVPDGPAPVAQPEVPPRTAVDAAFRDDAAFRHALTQNLKPLQAEAKAVAARVDVAFAAFTPTPLSAEELAARHFVDPGADPGETLDKVITEGLDERRSADTTRTLTLRSSTELTGLTTDGHVDLLELLGFVDGKSGSGSLVTEPVYTACKAELEAETIVAAVEKPAAGGGGNGAGGGTDGSAGDRDATQLVKDAVNLQMHSATAPETRLEYGAMPAIPNTADKDEAQRTILQTFELRPGASDVTSYHDFHTVQIAFPHVWSRIFDGELEALGRDLYREYVKLKDFSGSTTPDLRVGTVGDLRRLIDEVKKLSQTVEVDIPSDLRGGSGAPPLDGGASKGTDDLNTAVKAGVGIITGGLSWVLEWAIEEFSNINKKPIIRWEEFPGPWGNRRDRIHVSYDVAPADRVEIVLKTDAGSRIKILEFEPWDPASRTFVHGTPDMRISNAGHVDWVKMTLRESQLDAGVLEFASEESSAADIRGRYVLGDLGSALADGTRVVFHWTDS